MQEVSLVLRPAEISDAGILLAWRNDPQTIAASHNSFAVSEQEHLQWLKKAVSHKDWRIFIAEENGIPVGTARAVFDDKGDCWELSWTVAPEARGRGVAKRMVALLVQKFPGSIRAEVKAGNIASAKIAEAIGLKLIEESNGVLFYKKD